VLRKTVPDPNGSDWKSSVEVESTGNRQFVRLKTFQNLHSRKTYAKPKTNAKIIL